MKVGEAALPVDARRATRGGGAQAWSAMAEWRTRDPKTAVLLGLLVAGLAWPALTIYVGMADALRTNSRHYLDTAFLFWSWSRFVHQAAAPVEIYSQTALYAFQHAMDHSFITPQPFAYPPPFLLLIWPLGLLSRVPAYLLWVGVTLPLYLWAGWYRPWRWQTAVLGVLIPSTVVVVPNTQNGFLTAAMMIGGFRMVEKRPVLAGVLFGLLAFKPQLGLLIPIALVSAGAWQSIVAAVATVLLVVVASGAAFGWSMWLVLPQAMRGLLRVVAASPDLAHFSPTVTAAMHTLGASTDATTAAQVFSGLLVAAIVWLCFRRGVGRLPVAILLVGIFFTTPYAFFTDLPVVGYAILSVVIDRHEMGDPFGPVEIVVLIMAVLLPYLMAESTMPWGALVLLLLFGLIIRRWYAELRRSAPPGSSIAFASVPE